jgi:hypothetical protein
MISLNNVSTNYLQPILNSAIAETNSATNSSANTSSSLSSLSSTLQPDSSRLSPLAQLMSTLQQLQQSDPAKYQLVTGQIATKLEDESQTALANGNTTAATQLDQLSKDFTSASKSGQLPNVQDLAQAVGGHHGGHHHHHHVEAADAGASSSSTASSSKSDPLNPMAIIQDALSQSGIPAK